MNIRNSSVEPPLHIGPGDDTDVPPTEPRDPIEPDPMNSMDEELPTGPFRKQDKPPVGDPIRRKPTEIV